MLNILNNTGGSNDAEYWSTNTNNNSANKSPINNVGTLDTSKMVRKLFENYNFINILSYHYISYSNGIIGIITTKKRNKVKYFLSNGIYFILRNYINQQH